jgi:hypothetical protein
MTRHDGFPLIAEVTIMRSTRNGTESGFQYFAKSILVCFAFMTIPYILHASSSARSIKISISMPNPSPEKNSKWWAVCVDKSGQYLRQVEWPGKGIAIKHSAGKVRLRDGSYTTSYGILFFVQGVDRLSDMDLQKVIYPNGSWGKSSINGFYFDVDVEGYRVTILRDNNSKNLIAKSSDGKIQCLDASKSGNNLWWEPIWVGDLDKDGKPDYMLEIQNKRQKYSKIYLFLSSKAKQSEIFGLVAQGQGRRRDC